MGRYLPKGNQPTRKTLGALSAAAVSEQVLFEPTETICCDGLCLEVSGGVG